MMTRLLLPRDDLAKSLLPSFFLAGFECASHRRQDGVRLDLLLSTVHLRLARQDYDRACAHGLRAARDGVRWHVVEAQPGVYQWDSWLPMIRAAHSAGIKVIWDLCHYGWPDHLDIWSGGFVERFARYARAAARVLCAESDDAPMFCPINEISYWAWAGGEVGLMNPGATGRGTELKRQLVRAYIAAADAIREIDRRARFVVSEPLINVVSGSSGTDDSESAEHYRLAQFETHDMLTGVLARELGGRAEYLDVVGANFYPDNQWYIHGPTVPFGHHAYRPLSDMLLEVQQRYRRPLLISETGAEGAMRPYWLHHVCAEVRRANRRGASIEGICLYPILDYHGWENDRVCRVGLFSLPGKDGRRDVDTDLAAELELQLSMQDSGVRHRWRQAGR
jgi:beta-glucosidase/6-phospho-beta-glucosidase/beta-galactosidase